MSSYSPTALDAAAIATVPTVGILLRRRAGHCLTSLLQREYFWTPAWRSWHCPPPRSQWNPIISPPSYYYHHHDKKNISRASFLLSRFIPSWRQRTSPQSTVLRVLERKSYTLGYCTKVQSALWCTYTMSPLQLAYARCAPRPPFRPDPDVTDPNTKKRNAKKLLSSLFSNAHTSHKQSNAETSYDRGHLAPHYAVAIHTTAAEEAMYLSNISPQYPYFNRVVWRRLERALSRYMKGEDQIITSDFTKYRQERRDNKKRQLAVTVVPLFAKQSLLCEASGKPVPSVFCLAVLDVVSQSAVGYWVPHCATEKEAATRIALIDNHNDSLLPYQPLTLSELEAKISTYWETEGSGSTSTKTQKYQKKGKVTTSEQHATTEGKDVSWINRALLRRKKDDSTIVFFPSARETKRCKGFRRLLWDFKQNKVALPLLAL